MTNKEYYTREKIIELCDKGIVPLDKWSNRDTPSAQSGIGLIRTYLIAGCDFKLDNAEDEFDPSWIGAPSIELLFEFSAEEFGDCECGYFPSEKCLEVVNGNDWY
jgi:hypothetical protein